MLVSDSTEYHIRTDKLLLAHQSAIALRRVFNTRFNRTVGQMDVTREPRINDHFYRDFSLAAVLLSPECIFLFFIVTSQFSLQFLIEYFCESWERVLCSAVFQDSQCEVAYASNHTHKQYTISVAFEADRDIRKLLSELRYPN